MSLAKWHGRTLLIGNVAGALLITISMPLVYCYGFSPVVKLVHDVGIFVLIAAAALTLYSYGNWGLHGYRKW